MSILDTFFILFDSDASKLDKGLNETDKRAKKTEKSVKDVDAAAFKMGESIGTALKQIGGAVVAGFTLKAMVNQLMDATHYADELNESTERLGLNLEEVSAWGDLVKKNGGSAQGFIGSIEALNKQLSMMEVTGKSRAAPFLKELGIDLEDAANAGKTAMDFLPQIADAFMGMDKQKSVAMGQKLGFDNATIMTLQAGRREVEALLEKERELGVVTKLQGELADKFGDQLDDTRHAFRSLWLQVAQNVLPALTWLAEKFQNVALFMRKHSDFIVGIMIALGAAILAFALPPMISLAAATIAAFAPFLLLGAIVAALAVGFALLYDDIMNFIDGNDSLIGQIVEKFPQITAIVMGAVDAIKALGSAMTWTLETVGSVAQILYDLWKRMIGAIYEFSGIASVVNFIVDGWADKFKGLGQIVGDVWDWVITKVQQAIAVISSAIGLVKGVAGAITGALDGAKGALGISVTGTPGLGAGKALLSAAGASPLNSQTSSSVSNTRGGDKSIQTGPITVQTQATDAPGIARSLGGAMNAQFRNASTQMDDGVIA